ncbi:pyridoxamine 5'-phosphate oxidase family protein [Rathayibacter caricis]|uniref:pyridoxamine 5'-phosphate oxidase family protein n=1 Tax=Rathayibacter caricis TaxID=110936 RepID=UPI001FB4C8CE|nr:pyridoxamine 5'-phosphate oxidase family protein [Rathayibacter caricis]MCJ1697924.1 pyridoxamine 5'-phosphate oxidase family protein [Rathayibacter caricis]
MTEQHLADAHEVSEYGWSPQGAVVELTDADAWDLLGSRTFGHLGVISDGRPDIFPVDYACIDRTLVFRTDVGAKFRAMAHDHHVVFEVDARAASRTWSVVVTGHVEALPDDSELADRAALVLPPWVPTEWFTWIALHADGLRGRSFEHRLPIGRLDEAGALIP